MTHEEARAVAFAAATKAYDDAQEMQPREHTQALHDATEAYLATYLAARSAVLCDAEPIGWACHNAIENGMGLFTSSPASQVWDYAAQSWDNATKPLFAPLQPTEAAPAKVDAKLAEVRNAALEEAARLCDKEEAVRMSNMDAAHEGSWEWGDPRQASAAQGHKALTAAYLGRQIRALTTHPEAGKGDPT